ncbi:MAG: hypothetical protein NC311_10910 [Muribaculaceae bacterium]|nr:hypothetical protein [Muribaculaceae bacterium]
MPAIFVRTKTHQAKETEDLTMPVISTKTQTNQVEEKEDLTMLLVYQKTVNELENLSSGAKVSPRALTCEEGIAAKIHAVESQQDAVSNENFLKAAMCWYMGLVQAAYSFVEEAPERFELDLEDEALPETIMIQDGLEMLDALDECWQRNVCGRRVPEQAGEDEMLPFEKVIHEELDKALTSIAARRNSLENKMAFEMGRFSALLNMAEWNCDRNGMDLQRDFPACYNSLVEIAEFLTAVDGIWCNHFA